MLNNILIGLLICQYPCPEPFGPTCRLMLLQTLSGALLLKSGG